MTSPRSAGPCARSTSRPSKRIGQNFLHDQNLARWIVQQAESHVWRSSGRGRSRFGCIDCAALEAGAQVLAIEKDGAARAIFCAKASPVRASRSFTETRWNSNCGRLFPSGPAKLLGNLALLRVPRNCLLTFSRAANSHHIGVVDVTKGGRGASFCRAAFQRLRNSLRSSCRRNVGSNICGQCRRVFFSREPEVESALVRLTQRAPNEVPEHDRELF